MKNLRKICIIIFTALIFAVSIPSTNASAKVAISKTKQTLYVGQELKLSITGTKSSVKWSTSNKTVATVSKGKVVAKKAGTANITAKIGKKSYVCKITVKNLSLTSTNLVLYEGSTKTIKLTGAYQKVTWSTSNKNVATVSNGKIVAKKAGTVKITAKTGKKSYICKVTVKKLSLTTTNLVLYEGNTKTIKLTGAYTKVTWSTSNKNVATVSNGKIVAKKAGTVHITAKIGNKSYVCKVTVKNLSLTNTKLDLNEGDTKTINLTGAYQKVTWSTSNKNVATVTNGKVVAKKAGTAVIKATHNGKTYSCSVTVKSIFNSSTGATKISYSSYKLSDEVILIAKNNYTYAMSVTATITYFDDKGNPIFTYDDYNFCFEPNATSTFFFSNPYDADYNDVPYSDYKITFSVDEATSRTPNSRDIKLSGSIGASDFIVSSTNIGNIESDGTCVAVVYYKNGAPIFYAESFVETSNIGETSYTNFNLPYNSDYEYIEFDSYELFIKYSFKWTF